MLRLHGHKDRGTWHQQFSILIQLQWKFHMNHPGPICISDYNLVMTTVKSLIEGAPNKKLKCFSSRLAVVFVQHIEARCQVKNQDAVGAVWSVPVCNIAGPLLGTLMTTRLDMVTSNFLWVSKILSTIYFLWLDKIYKDEIQWHKILLHV